MCQTIFFFNSICRLYYLSFMLFIQIQGFLNNILNRSNPFCINSWILMCFTGTVICKFKSIQITEADKHTDHYQACFHDIT